LEEKGKKGSTKGTNSFGVRKGGRGKKPGVEF